MLTISNVAGHEALSGDWTIVMSQSNGGNPEIIQDHPYYKQNDGDLHMWWMWHPEQGESFGHWVVNDTPGSHGSDVIKSKYQTFACPQDNPTWFLPDGQTEVPMGWNGEFVVEPISCMCDKMTWSGEGIASGEWEKTDQWNDEWPVYKNEEQDLFMWWMWHGKQGHWVINATPGTHGNDQAKTVGFFDHKCATEFVPWSVGNNGEDFTIQCMPQPCHNTPTYELKAKRSSIQRYGVGSFGVKVNTPKVPETTAYTGLLAWGKGDCGQDFLERVNSGDVGLWIVDQQMAYEIKYKYFADRDSKHSNVVIQYQSDACAEVDAAGNAVKCLGNTKKDQMELFITGTDTVNWGSKDAATCISSLRNGFIGTKDSLTMSTTDMTQCIAWTNNYWN